jgi:hypothetical protein
MANQVEVVEVAVEPAHNHLAPHTMMVVMVVVALLLFLMLVHNLELVEQSLLLVETLYIHLLEMVHLLPMLQDFSSIKTL